MYVCSCVLLSSLFFVFICFIFFFFKQKTAYEMRISDWSSDVCSSDLKNLRFLRDKKQGVYLAVYTPYRTEFHNLVAVYHNLDAATAAMVHVGIYLFFFVDHVIDALCVAVYKHPV